MKRTDFIKRLEKARAAVVAGETGCATAPDKCWYCAMRWRSGPPTPNDGSFWKFKGPDQDWSVKRPKSDTLAMFDNSIAALRAELSSQGTER